MSDRPLPTTFSCCAFSVEAVATTVAQARQRLRRCLAEAHWPPAEAEHLVLAVNEAVSNAIQHAYHPDEAPRRTVEVAVMIEFTTPGPHREQVRRVRVVVADEGRWRGHPADITQVLDRPGGGFGLMKALTSRVVVDLHPSGTRVVLVSEPVPVRDPARWGDPRP